MTNPPASSPEPEVDRSHWTIRTIDASCDDVFQAIRDPARLARWWGPAGFTNTIHEFDLRPGGRWRMVMHGPDGTDYPNESVFVDVVPNERLVIEHLSGHHFVLAITLVPAGRSTEVHWRQTFDSIEHFRPIAAFVSAANEQNLDRLTAEVKRAIDDR